MSFSVYCHTNKTNGKKYIGITQMNPKRRWLSGNGYKSNKKFWPDIQKYGWKDGFSHDVLFEGLSQDEAVLKEAQLIRQYDTVNSGYNQSPGGRYGKPGLLSHENNLIFNGMKKSAESGYFQGWIEHFEFANTFQGEADFLNLATSAILPNMKKLGFPDLEHWMYDGDFIVAFLVELGFFYDIDAWVNAGQPEGKFPKFKGTELQRKILHPNVESGRPKWLIELGM